MNVAPFPRALGTEHPAIATLESRCDTLKDEVDQLVESVIEAERVLDTAKAEVKACEQQRNIARSSLESKQSERSQVREVINHLRAGSRR